jgi:hypothetical protein
MKVAHCSPCYLFCAEICSNNRKRFRLPSHYHSGLCVARHGKERHCLWEGASGFPVVIVQCAMCNGKVQCAMCNVQRQGALCNVRCATARCIVQCAMCNGKVHLCNFKCAYFGGPLSTCEDVRKYTLERKNRLFSIYISVMSKCICSGIALAY